MQVSLCSFAVAGMALAGGGVAAIPAAPTPAITQQAVQLTAVDTGDVGNVPLNLFYALANVPAAQLNSIQEMANALYFGGPWLVPSATNLWGTDLADPPKIEAITDLLVPFPALSKALAEQIAGFMQAEMPTYASCDSMGCIADPNLYLHWFQVPLSQLMAGYTFPTDGPTVDDPYGAVAGAYGFEGTVTSGEDSVMPWAGTTFTLDLVKPFEDFYNSLTATPPDLPDAIQVPTLTDIANTFSSFLESLLVAANPFLPGGPYDPSAELSAELPNLLSGFGVADGTDFGTMFDGLIGDFTAMWTQLL